MADSTPADTATLSAVPSAMASAINSAVGTPQSLPPMDPEERAKSINVSLADMVAKATALYQSKKYEEAAEIFSTTTERQAELNGEMAPENADVLFLYGRCLFKVGQSNSDVLGGKAPTSEKKKTAEKAKAKKLATAATEEKTDAEKVTEEGVALVAKNASTEELGEGMTDAKKPLFQFTGDETFEDSDEEEEGAEAENQEEEEEEDDDLAVAFEILELSRVLFEQQLQASKNPESTEDTDKKVEEGEEDKMSRHITERLSDIHDLLAEISLENEKFPEAIKDCRATLKYKQELYSQDSEIIAEAHFKLSLALEFASITTTSGEEEEGSKTVNEEMRNEAADELVKAIESTKLKLKNKEVDLAMMHAPEDNEETRKQITEVKEILADMEQRLTDLRKPPVDMNDALGQDNPLSGILGQVLGESSTQAAERVEEARKNAKDLSGLVRKKTKKPEPESEAKPEESNGKRKAEDPADGGEDSKKAKVEEST
ncbi:hypothetical protein F5Y16DRAFT_356753 [Xylariaceae sp. FL0255]|nr:hypothetical protein F5Y16DRAFT_356753 [Xylariaceae sp. FL0255]